MKIKFNSDDGLPLNKQVKFINLTIIVTDVFEENGKYYPQIFLDQSLYVSEGIDPNKSDKSKECMVCYY